MQHPIEKPDLDYLVHYGVPGMKWGKRKAQQISTAVKKHKVEDKALRDKMKKAAVTANKKNLGSDLQYLKYGKQSMGKRYTDKVVGNVINKAIAEMITGELRRNMYYYKTDKKRLAKDIGKLAAKSAVDMAVTDMLAKNVAKRYDDNGKHIKKTKGLLTPEEKITIGLQVGPSLAKGAAFGAAYVAKKQILKNLKKEDAFARYTGKLLEQSKYQADIVMDKDGNIEWVRDKINKR